MTRLWFTLGVLVLYRLGKHVPLPGLDPSFLQRTIANATMPPVSLCILGVSPYITASFWLLILDAIWRGLTRRGRPTAGGERLLDQFTRFAALLLAAIQGYALANGFEAAGFAGALAADSPVLFKAMTIAVLVAATGILIWLADQITRRGLGNGVGLILFSDLVSQLPRPFGSLLEEVRVGMLSPQFLILFVALVVVVVAGMVFVESARRLVGVHYAPRQVGTATFPGASSYLRLKLNSFGVIPAVFASALILVPASIASFSAANANGWIGEITSYIGLGHPAYLVLYGLLIVALAFFYRMIILNPRQMVDALRSYGGVLSGSEPGISMVDDLKSLLRRLTLVGALYVAAVCVLPEILSAQGGLPFYFGGSSLLVVVCVSLDLVREVRLRLRQPAAFT
jgi:preprotein translocase subunit SecY